MDVELAPREQQRPGTSGGRRRPPLAAHHRRRRATAGLAAVAAVALLAGVVVGAGASGGAPAAKRVVVSPSGYFSRIRTLAGTGPSSFAASEEATENAAVTRTLAYTPYVRIAGSQHRELALTFDDGPGPYTPQILRILERTHTPATFFEVGIEEQWFHASTTQIVDHGFVIGDHTENHYAMSSLSRADQQAQLLRESAAIGAYGAPFPRLFRPPYGLWNSTTLSVLRKYRMLMVLWSADTSDYELPGTRAIVDRALAGARPGAIILMHDAGGNRSETVAALPIIIRDLRAKGYRLVTVPKLLLDNPAPAHQAVAGLAGAGG